MNKRYAELMSLLGWTDESTKEATYLLELVVAVEENREQILAHINSIASDVSRIRLIMKPAHPLLNSLGELQQRPAAVEAAVGAFAATDRLLEKYLALHGVTE